MAEKLCTWPIIMASCCKIFNFCMKKSELHVLPKHQHSCVQWTNQKSGCWGYRGVCSTANPKQNLKQTQSGAVLRGVMAQRSCIAQGKSRSKLNLRAAVSCGWGLYPSHPAVLEALHISQFLFPVPAVWSIRNYSLKPLFLVEGFW